MTVGEQIKALRENAGLTQTELGEKVGVSGVAIMRYEKNKRQPRIEHLQRIADALEVPVTDLFDNEPLVLAIVKTRTRKRNKNLDNSDLLPSEFNEFERFIETLGYYTRLDGENYRLHKGKSSVVITPDELKALVRVSKATVAALVQNLMETVAMSQPPATTETDKN